MSQLLTKSTGTNGNENCFFNLSHSTNFQHSKDKTKKGKIPLLVDWINFFSMGYIYGSVVILVYPYANVEFDLREHLIQQNYNRPTKA